MYTVSDIVDMGAAHELILAVNKEVGKWDDSEEVTMDPLEYFDE